jgi:hypothetical protein
MCNMCRPFITQGSRIVRPHAMALALTRLLEHFPGADRRVASQLIAKQCASLQCFSAADAALLLNRPVTFRAGPAPFLPLEGKQPLKSGATLGVNVTQSMRASPQPSPQPNAAQVSMPSRSSSIHLGPLGPGGSEAGGSTVVTVGPAAPTNTTNATTAPAAAAANHSNSTHTLAHASASTVATPTLVTITPTVSAPSSAAAAVSAGARSPSSRVHTSPSELPGQTDSHDHPSHHHVPVLPAFVESIRRPQGQALGVSLHDLLGQCLLFSCFSSLCPLLCLTHSLTHDRIAFGLQTTP